MLKDETEKNINFKNYQSKKIKIKIMMIKFDRKKKQMMKSKKDSILKIISNKTNSN
jgi:hypothetical protein